MAVNIPRGPRPDQDDIFQAIIGALERYEADHPGAVVEAYRHGRYSVHLRVVDERFANMSRIERHQLVWPYLDALPEEVLNDVGTLILLAPEEKETSLASLDFDDPVPARL
jgi:stress-induced morphogen